MLEKLLILLFIYVTHQKSDVYYTKRITPEDVVKMFRKLNTKLTGNIGLKVHTGEIGGKYFLTPDFLQKIYEHTNGTFIETNTAFLLGDRYTTDGHRTVLAVNGWSKKNRRIVIMDEEPDNDFTLQIPKHTKIKQNYVGARLREFDSCLVLAHFKGHSLGGFGGALKQLSIGFASRRGKAYIHSCGNTTDYIEVWGMLANQPDFTGAMADAASSIVNYFKKKGNILYINVMSNISLKCDCEGVIAPPPRIRDLGILASTDPVAIDKASYDLIVKEGSEGAKEWLNNSESKLGTNTIRVAEQLGIGTQDYKLIDVDNLMDESVVDHNIWNMFIPISIFSVIGISFIGILLFNRK